MAIADRGVQGCLRKLSHRGGSRIGSVTPRRTCRASSVELPERQSVREAVDRVLLLVPAAGRNENRVKSDQST